MKVRIIILAFIFLVLLPSVAQTQKRSSKARTTQKVSSTKKKSTYRKTATVKKPATKKKVTPKESISSLRSRRSTLQKQISRNQSQLAATNRDVKRQLGDLAVLNGKIDKQQRYIEEIQGQVDSLSLHIRQLTREFNKLSEQLEDRKQKFRKSMIYLYKNNNQDNKLLFILSADNFTQMLRRYRLVTEYGKYQQKQGELIKKKQKQIEDVKTQLVQTKDSKDKMLVVQKDEHEKLAQQQDERQKKVNQLKKRQREITNIIAANKKEMAALDAKIDYYVKLAIEQERKRREAEERARKEAERKAALASANGNSSARENSSSKSNTKAAPMQQWRSNTKEYALTSNFASNKGRLPMPITGSYVISAHYGNYTMGGMKGVQLSNKGINITGQSGAKARCIFPGEVSAVFSLGGLVNVLVRHGSYISVYCNLSSASVRSGQRVEARAVLGNIARDASGHYTLHFQLRKETATLNPESWLAR
jgi:septal ring factor EnvC (AmiA/AmiB activator)